MSERKSLFPDVPPVADISLLRLTAALGHPPKGASDLDVAEALDRVIGRAQDYARLAKIEEQGGGKKLVELIQRAAPFVNAVAVMATPNTKALAWLADAALAVGTPDPDYACGAAYCDDPACATHGARRAE